MIDPRGHDDELAEAREAFMLLFAAASSGAAYPKIRDALARVGADVGA